MPERIKRQAWKPFCFGDDMIQIHDTIIIENGDVFEGNLEQFKNCFFDNANAHTIKMWCDKWGYSFRVRTDVERVTEIKKKIQDLRFEMDDILDKYLGEGEGQCHKIGTWECEDSPVGFCVYNPFEDKRLDNCIYCHKPNERK